MDILRTELDLYGSVDPARAMKRKECLHPLSEQCEKITVFGGGADPGSSGA